MFYRNQSSILAQTSRRMSGSCSFSSGVNLERTKSISGITPPDLARVLESVPRRRRGKSEVPSCLIVDFRPLLPPAEPFSRKRIFEKSRSKSSHMIKMSPGAIL